MTVLLPPFNVHTDSIYYIMTKILHLSAAMLVVAAAFFSCAEDPKMETAADQTPKADTIKMPAPLSADGAATFTVTEGTVYWAAKKAGGKQHNGSIKVKGGSLKVKEGQILSGSVTIDMGSVEVLDLKDPGEKGDLEKHLKDSDFFEVNKYPEGTFVFDGVLPSNNPAFNTVIPGNLTLKGKSNTVNIPIKTTLNEKELVAESTSFIINRTNWGINFRAGILGTAKDKLIEDNVMLSFTLKAKAQ